MLVFPSALAGDNFCTSQHFHAESINNHLLLESAGGLLGRRHAVQAALEGVSDQWAPTALVGIEGEFGLGCEFARTPRQLFLPG